MQGLFADIHWTQTPSGAPRLLQTQPRPQQGRNMLQTSSGSEQNGFPPRRRFGLKIIEKAISHYVQSVHYCL